MLFQFLSSPLQSSTGQRWPSQRRRIGMATFQSLVIIGSNMCWSRSSRSRSSGPGNCLSFTWLAAVAGSQSWAARRKTAAWLSINLSQLVGWSRMHLHSSRIQGAGTRNEVGWAVYWYSLKICIYKARGAVAEAEITGRLGVDNLYRGSHIRGHLVIIQERCFFFFLGGGGFTNNRRF